MNILYPIPGFSEPFSSLSHLLGAGIFLVLSIPLLKLGKGDFWKLIALSIFFLAGVFTLTISGVYHLLAPEGVAKVIFKRLDHSAIFVLIVGTMTPVHQILFKGFMRWGWLFLIWIIAITSLILKNMFFTSFPEWLGLTLFLSLGWLGGVSGGIIWYRRNFSFIKPLVFGGLAYTIGAIMEFNRFPILVPGVLGPHELFHVAVLIGLSLHLKFIYNIVCANHIPIENKKSRY